MLGGRAAELIQFHVISTGASDDITRATELARRMVVEFGMSPKLGTVRYAGEQLQYLGKSVEDDSHLSPETRQLIDREVQRIVTEQYERAQKLLVEHQAALGLLASELLEKETVDGDAVKKALGAQPTAVVPVENSAAALVANSLQPEKVRPRETIVSACPVERIVGCSNSNS